MQLRRLEVSNIRSFERGRLDLGPGTTLLVGDVGAGKSSLLYAVEMALFGVAEVDAAFLVRHGTMHADVAVTLEDAHHTYAVRRRFRKVRRRGRETYEPEKLTFAEDGRPTAYSATEIRQRVIDLLGFPDNPNPHAHSDLWRWAIYVPQERMRDILAADPEERLETVRKALGVERYRTAADNAQVLSADLRLSARRRREEAARMAHWDVEFAETTREADRLRADRSGLVATVAQGQAALEMARARREKAEAALAQAETDRREHERLRREQDADARALAETARRSETLSTEIEASGQEATALRAVVDGLAAVRTTRASADENVRSHRQELERHAGDLRDLARASAALEAAERRLVDATDRAEKARSERDQAERTLSELQEQPPLREPPCPTRRTVPEIEAELSTVLASEREAFEAMARLRTRRDQIEQLLTAGVCPTCQQPVQPERFAAHREEAATALARGETAHGARVTARERLEEERKARERYERAHERWAELDRRRKEARQALTAREVEWTASTESATRALSEAEAARALIARLRPVEAEETRRRQELDRLEAVARDLRSSEEKAVAAGERLRAIEAIAQRLRTELSRLGTDLDSLRRRSDERSRRLAELEASVGTAGVAAEARDGAKVLETTAERRLAEAQGSLVRSDTRLDGLVERVANAERGRAERATLIAEATDLEGKAEWVAEPFRIAVLRMEKELLAHAQAVFDRSFARFFASLIDDPSLVARTDVSFTPEVTIAGEATPAEALSGGERTSLALAFRLALASVVRSLGTVRLQTLLLDEPTDGFSTEQVVRMGELLEELALPQVLLVSHESELAGVADHTVRVVKVDGRSTLEPDGPDRGETNRGGSLPARES